MARTSELGRPATAEDLERLPPHLKGEIIEGVLYTQPRPRARHANVETSLVSDLHGPFQRGRGGPGGWWILAGPGIEVPGSPEFSPDVAGWRRVDVDAQTLAVSTLEGGRWVELGVHGADERVRAQPFPEVELELDSWWT